MKTLPYSTILLAFIAGMFYSCEGTVTSSETESKTSEFSPSDDASEVEPTAVLEANELLYPWVDKLNLRAEPSPTAKVITQVKEGDALTFSGVKSVQNEQLTLRGITFDEPWAKVTTADNQTGWVFLGAVKRNGENKGRPLASKDVIDFPHFGRYDLRDWQLQSTEDNSGGDAEGFIKTYIRGIEVLEISETDVGEYGYYRTQVLKDRNGKTLRKRELEFMIDPSFLLTEKVFDYQSSPARLYSRSQRFNKHYMQLNARPIMVDGLFQVNDIDNAGGELQLEAFGYAEWPQALQSVAGCSCAFRPDEEDYNAEVFANNLGSEACIKVNGEVFLLQGGRTDQRMEYYNRGYNDAWITLNEQGGSYVFNKKINTDPDNWHEIVRGELINTLLVMDQLPDEIPVKENGDIGMGTRAAFRDMCNEALDVAKRQRKNGETGIPIKMVYANDRYLCEIVAKVSGQTDGGGDTYVGELTLKSKDGEVLLTQPVWGDCGC